MQPVKYSALIAAVLLAAGCLSPTATPEPITIRVAYASEADFLDMPSFMAHAELAKLGYKVEPNFYAETELSVEALARGDADIALGSMTTFWTAVTQGANVATVMEHNSNSWSIYTAQALTKCDDLDGQAFAISSEGAVSTALSKAYIEQYCPDAKPNFVILGRSSARAAALIAGEIGATAIELADAVEIDTNAPGEFHALTKMAEDLPDIKTSGVHVNSGFAQAHPQALKDYLRVTLMVHRQIAEDTSSLSQAVLANLDVDPDLLPRLIEAHMAVDSWDMNGGLTAESVQATLDFFKNFGDLDKSLTAEQVSDLSFLVTVLDEIGRQ